MILVQPNKVEDLTQIAADMELLHDFIHCDLIKLSTLELSELNPYSSHWIASKPIVFDADAGIVIFEFEPVGVAWLLNNVAQLADFGVEAQTLTRFCENNSPKPIYIIDTF